MSIAIRYIAISLALAAANLLADAPTTDGLFPNGLRAGGEVEVSLSGKVKTWPPEFWCSNPKVTIKAGEKSPKATVSIAKDADAGPCLIRAYNADGSSEPFIYMVGESDVAEVFEDEKAENRSVADAQKIEQALPCVIYGRLNATKDVDCFQIPLKKGQALYAFMEGYSFRGGLDGILHLYSPDGARVKLAHDNAVNLDPELIYQATEDGNYTLAVMAFATPPSANIHFHGGTKCSYRINLALTQKDLPSRLLPTVSSDGAMSSEPLSPPIELFRTLEKPGQIDSYVIAVKNKQSFQIDVLSESLRAPTDPVLRLYRPDGRLIKEIDDATKTSRNSGYLWKVVQDGNYRLTVQDRFGKFGSAYRYHLKVAKPEPDFSVSIDKSNYVAEAGKELEIKLKLTRSHGHSQELELDIVNLPKSISFKPPEIPKKSGDLSFKLKVDKQADVFSGAIQFRLKEEGGAGSKLAEFTFQDKDARGPYLINAVSDIWLTVKASPKE